MTVTPEENPWGDRCSGSAECGVTLGTCPHCDTRTWMLKVYLDPRVPKQECAHCGAVWEGDNVMQEPEVRA